MRKEEGRLDNKVKELRNLKNLTQEELGQIFGITADYISMIERGERTPGFKLAKRIADYFGTTVDDLFFYNPIE